MKSAMLLTSLMIMAEEGAQRMGYKSFDEACEAFEAAGVWKNLPQQPPLPPLPPAEEEPSMQPHHTVLVGDKVRSYDFPDGRRTSYVEGTVVGLEEQEGCMRYKIRVERSVWPGNDVCETERERYVYPPVNGTPKSSGGVCDGVEKIS